MISKELNDFRKRYIKTIQNDSERTSKFLEDMRNGKLREEENRISEDDSCSVEEDCGDSTED